MQTKLMKKSIFILAILSIILLSSCLFTPSTDGEDEEIQLLREQVNQLATQNASLQDQLSDSKAEEMEVPPPLEEDDQNQISLLTPTPEFLPDEPVPAGVPIVYDGWSMIVSKELWIGNGVWGIEIFVRNLGETDRVFRYTNAGITTKDDIGNIYDYDNQWYVGGTCEEFHHTVKNLDVCAECSERIDSSGPCFNEEAIQAWQGPIPLEATQLIIMFENFGPFDGVEVVIDL